MKVLIDLNEKTLDNVAKSAKKNKRSRKREMEVIIEDAVN